MDSVKWFLGLKPTRTQPPKVPTDEVYPVHYLDDTPTNRKQNMTWLLRFEDFLDVDILQNSLNRLLQRDGWRKLAGRIRLTSNDKLEIHVPREFTPERPAFRLSHNKFDMPLNAHPLARLLPKYAEKPYIQPLGTIFRDLEARHDIPLTTYDLCYCDEPQLAVHITSFSDETLVSLSWPHIMTSALGRQALMKSWSLILAGRDDEVPPFSGAHDDPMEKLGRVDDPVQEEFVLENKRLHGWGFARLAINMLWEMYWRPYMEVKIIYLPAAFVARLRRGAQQDLQTSVAGSGQEAPFISEGDVFAAWTSRILSRSRGNCPITAATVVDIQGRFKSVFTPGHAYVQNTILGAFAIFGKNEANTATLGEQALKVRESLVKQTTEQQCEALLRLGRKTDDMPLYGEPDGKFLVVTNWTKAKFTEIIDFAPAVVRKGVPDDKRRTEPGRIVYHHPNILGKSVSFRDCIQVMGKDKEGNYWFKGAFLQEFWDLFEKEVYQDTKA